MKKIIFFTLLIFNSLINLYGGTDNNHSKNYLNYDDPQITNNSIAWNGVDTFIGSVPNGGDGNYTYSWEIWISETGEGPNNFPPGNSIDLVLTFGMVTVGQSGDYNIFFRRTIYSGDQISFSNWASFDWDGDGIDNLNDNCLNIVNPDQIDTDNDGIGEICDNCPNIPNPNQEDIDNDGIGNLCDDDKDGDNVLNINDKCPSEFGNSSNFGCFGNPDYIINDDSELSAPGWGNYDLNYADFSNNPIFLSRFDGGFIYITKLLIDNRGDGDAHIAPVKINFYISTDTNVSSDDFKFSTYTQMNQRLDAGETTNYTNLIS